MNTMDIDSINDKMEVDDTNSQTYYFEELKRLMENDTAVADKVVAEGFYEWPIEDWDSLIEKKEYSPEFKIGSYRWRILLFPKGNTESEFVSAFLDNLDVKDEGADESAHVCAKFVLSIRNYNDYSCFSPKRN